MKASFPKGCRPAIGIIPLGTGNDLSRSLNWGGKYRDKPLRKVLIDIAKADIINMDRQVYSLTIRTAIIAVSYNFIYNLKGSYDYMHLF